MADEQKCDACGGDGKIARLNGCDALEWEVCSKCNGTGKQS